jgi:hypothetical protein
MFLAIEHTREGAGACRDAYQPNPEELKFKDTNFVDFKISIVVGDLNFSRNQLLKSADD